jgi:uncharacterized MAPEG superfamily protein
MPAFATTEMQMLWASLVLGFVHLLAAAFTSVSQRGMKWAAGPRDEATPPLNAVGGRLDRAWKNYLETLPLFVGAIIAQAASGNVSNLAPLGALLYFWGRVAYLPAYATGWPYVRTLAWGVAMLGIVLLLIACLPGM